MVNRRQFLQRALAATTSVAAGAPCLLLPGFAPSSRSARPQPGRKLLIVQFGGGTRYSESMGDPAHRFIPRLWKEMVPRGTLFTNMRVEGKVVHPNSTGSILSGHWEWADLDWTKPLTHPTVFEIHRRANGTGDLKAWAFVYASILAKAGESSTAGFGEKFAANVVEPPTIPRAAAEEMDRLMQEAAAAGTEKVSLDAIEACAKLARHASHVSLAGLRSAEARAFVEKHYAAWKSGQGTTSHDAFLTDGAIACMKAYAPDVLAVCFGEIDCAHYGSWSRYVEAIQRTDELTWHLWETVQSLEAYRGRTLVLVLPDHGRELERPGGLGFVHHSDFYKDTGADEGCRRVWLLALGPEVPASRTVAEPMPITTVAATGLEFLGLRAWRGAAPSIWGKLPLEAPRR
jgi:hypothetical protein